MTTPGLRQPISPKRILVAEDDALVARTLSMSLAVDGHKVEVAQDGQQALAMFEAGDYDLVITDFKMDKMDGLELAEAIKKRAPSKPVILLTAYVEAIGGKMGEVSNVDLLLGKPLSVRDLQAALNKVFSAR
jgi:ATP-dependent Lon protease